MNRRAQFGLRHWRFLTGLLMGMSVVLIGIGGVTDWILPLAFGTSCLCGLLFLESRARKLFRSHPLCTVKGCGNWAGSVIGLKAPGGIKISPVCPFHHLVIMTFGEEGARR